MMIKRESLMDEQFFEGNVNFIDDAISKRLDQVRNPEPDFKLNGIYQDLYTYSYRKLECFYSMGHPIDNLTPVYRECLQALRSYKNHPKAKSIFFINEVDEYMNALTLLTWGLSLSLDQALFDELVAHIDAEGKRDALLDMLIARRRPDRPISPTLYFPKLYTPLLEAAQNRSSQQMAHFLTQWYKTCLRKTSSYDIHKLGDDSSFSGYWAWEVAGLTYALDLDDSSYRTLPYYPGDLVAYARQ